MNKDILYINGEDLTNHQLMFVALTDVNIPAEFDKNYVLDQLRVNKRLELLKTMERPYFFKVAMNRENIIGFHIVVQMFHLSRIIANTLTLWVDPAYRRTGIAQDLKSRGLLWATDQGYPFIQTHVNVKNKRMLEINKKIGFKDDMYLMRKELLQPTYNNVPASNYWIPTFHTERLILKAPNLNDAENYQKYFSDYEVVRNLSDLIPWPYPENGAREYLNNIVIPLQGKDRWTWGIYTKEKPGELIGCIDLFKRRTDRGNRGFWLGKKFWNQGMMTEAVKPITDYAFLHLGFDKLAFNNAQGNIGSRRVKEKTGARFIGTKISSHVDPSLNQSEQWELTREDWLKHSKPSFIANYKDLMDKDDSRYPNSDELLAISSPVGKKLGLHKIGIHIETLPPGRRTSWPHAESEEEEFAYVIKGHPQIWLNGFMCDLTEGDFVALPSGTGIAHTFINNSKDTVILMVGGQSKLANNKILYPMHPKRNVDMKNLGRLWENLTQAELGPHDATPS